MAANQVEFTGIWCWLALFGGAVSIICIPTAGILWLARDSSIRFEESLERSSRQFHESLDRAKERDNRRRPVQLQLRAMTDDELVGLSDDVWREWRRAKHGDCNSSTVLDYVRRNVNFGRF
jgi:hypothetical protein